MSDVAYAIEGIHWATPKDIPRSIAFRFIILSNKKKRCVEVSTIVSMRQVHVWLPLRFSEGQHIIGAKHLLLVKGGHGTDVLDCFHGDLKLFSL